MRVTALAGGVGGAKLLVGLQDVLQPDSLTAVVNTGDDARIYGVDVSPDVDIVTYWLAGIADTTRGWGVMRDTFSLLEELQRLGLDTWFRLGDRDFATCVYRSTRLAEGATRSMVADELRRALGIPTRVVPMSDDPAPTTLTTADGRELEFQEYFVKERTQPEIVSVRLGAADAKPAPGVVDAIEAADRIVICPSNPIVSIGPILAIPEIRRAVRDHPFVIAVSPIVGGETVKGPADRLLRSLGHESSATGVAALYAELCDVFVLDQIDGSEARRVEELGVRAVALDTLMVDSVASARLARALVEL